jgi:hypothetical protein
LAEDKPEWVGPDRWWRSVDTALGQLTGEPEAMKAEKSWTPRTASGSSSAGSRASTYQAYPSPGRAVAVQNMVFVDFAAAEKRA